MVQTILLTGDFQWSIYNKRWLNTLYTYVHLVKKLKTNLKLTVLMVPWYIKVQMMSFKNFNIKCFLNRLLKHSKFGACFTEMSRLSQSCVPRYLKVLSSC